MASPLFGSALWTPALDKYAEATGLTVNLYGADGALVLASQARTPLAELFREEGFDPGLFAECVRRCVDQLSDRPAVSVAEAHGLTVVGTSLVLDGELVGAAVAGYALAGFSGARDVQHWARTAGLPFARLWSIVRQQPPLPERRLRLHGELLQVLGDALLRENLRTRQYEDTAAKLQAASAAKDQFLAVLSHELRTPLVPIAGWAGVLKTSENLVQVRHGAEIIERNAFLQSRMVDELLDLSHVAHGSIALELEVLDLRDIASAAVDDVAQAMQAKAITLEMSPPDEPLLVEADAGRLQQILRNVLANAVKFTPPGGRVRVELSREAGQALIRVSDTGKGIAPEFLPFAFDIFRQQHEGTRRSHEGLGIGLALVKKLTELHGGTVGLASPGEGGGTEVTMRLPLAGGGSTAAGAAADPAARLDGLSILVVEDSADARETLRELLHTLGAHVTLASDGREALELLREAPAPDAVLCDLLMPRMDGFELVRELGGGTMPPRPPVVAVSGIGSVASRERARRAGFAGHLRKPFDAVSLVAALRTALAARAAK